jgi:hypothetical protein
MKESKNWCRELFEYANFLGDREMKRSRFAFMRARLCS